MDDIYLPDGQNTRLSQVTQKELAKLPDGSPSYRLQISYLQKFFGTPWYLVYKDTFELYAIYDMTISETPYCAQIKAFDLVALDTDLQENMHSRMSHINMRKGWVTQITDSYEKWISTATISKSFPCSMLTLND